MTDNDKLSSNEIELLKFEYERLHTEKIKNTDMSYRMITVFITVSAGLLAYTIKNYSPLRSIELVAIAAVSILPLLIAYLIDRRLTYTNQIMNARIEQIEEIPEFKVWISRLFNENDCLNDNPALRKKIREKKEKYCGCLRIYERLHVHHFFFIYIAVISLIFALLLIIKNPQYIVYFLAVLLSILLFILYLLAFLSFLFT